MTRDLMRGQVEVSEQSRPRMKGKILTLLCDL